MKKSGLIKPLTLLIGLCAAFALWRFTSLGHHVSLQNAQALSAWAGRLGWIAPFGYIVVYAVGAVLLVPGSVLSAVGGLSFGVFYGTVLVSIGTTAGACLAFLTARYLARPWIESILAKRPAFQRIDRGVARHGWRMVAVVRLVPIFPYMFINYALGLTDIRFTTYAGVTFVCMIPANFAICLAAGSLVSGGDDWKRIFIYLLGAGVLFALLAVLPMLLKKRLPDDLAEQLNASEKL